MAEEIRHFINGKLASGKSGRTAPVFNPATGEVAGQVALASAAEVDEAVRIAQQAFPKWAHTPPLRRARILMRFLRLLEENEDRIARVITAEHGKVLSDAKGELARGVEVVEFATGAPQLLKGEVTENVGTRPSCQRYIAYSKPLTSPLASKVIGPSTVSCVPSCSAFSSALSPAEPALPTASAKTWTAA